VASGLIPRHVLMSADAVGGVWTYAVDLARGLSALGSEVTLAVLGPGPEPRQAAAARAIRRVNLLETGLPLDWTAARPADLAEAGEAVATLARELGADLVHLNSPALAADASFDAPVVGACHSCLATWWSAVRHGPMPEDMAWRAAATRKGYAACHSLMAPTAAFAMATRTAHGVEAPAVVRNGRQPMSLRGCPTKADRLVFTAGRLWDAGKNLSVLDAAAEAVDAPVFAAGLLIGPNGDRVRLANIEALGPQDEHGLAYWYARAPIFCSVPLYEPFGLSVLEAAQAGCALVLSDIPTHRELWDGAAVFVDPEDSAGLADALNRVLDDPQLREALANAAKAQAQHYTASAMTAGVLDVYRSVMAPASRPYAEAVA
jgi:glycogen(starch) synthase